MSEKIKLTRPEMKRQRDALSRFQRYLPMLKLKQQQLQAMVRNAAKELNEASDELQKARAAFEPHEAVLSDVGGVNVRELAQPTEVKTDHRNIAGVMIPMFKGLEFPTPNYSLFGTPIWVDQALTKLRELSGKKAQVEVLQKQFDLLNRELTKIVQRVNLFEKVMIPEAKDAIRRISIHLGDEMTSAVGRGKIAKSKLEKIKEAQAQNEGEAA